MLAGAMLLRGFRLFGVALHREPKGTKRRSKDLMGRHDISNICAAALAQTISVRLCYFHLSVVLV